MPEINGLFVGLSTIDIQFGVNHFPVINSKTKAEKYGVYTGGPAANAAAAFSYLGGNTRFITAIGENVFTDFMYKDFKKLNVEIFDLMRNRAFEPVFASIITSENNGDRTVFSYHPPKNKALDLADFELPADKIDIILLDGFYMNTAKKVAKWGQENNIPVVLDGGSWKPGMDELIAFIDIAICSNDFTPPTLKLDSDIRDYFLKRNISKVAVTRGEKSIYFVNNNENSEIEVPKITAVDTLGAGDFFHGAFCFYFVQTKHFIKALKKASQIAARSCQYFGTREWMQKSLRN